MFLWSAHEKFQKHFTGRSNFFEILGPAHNGGCPCYFVAMKKWCAVAKKKGVLDNNRRGACDFTLQIQKPQIIILLSGSPCSHHFLFVHTWIRSLSGFILWNYHDFFHISSIQQPTTQTLTFKPHIPPQTHPDEIMTPTIWSFNFSHPKSLDKWDTIPLKAQICKIHSINSQMIAKEIKTRLEPPFAYQYSLPYTIIVL